MEDVEELARKVWYAHPMCPEPVRQSNIKKWKAAVEILGTDGSHGTSRPGSRPLALTSMPSPTHRR